jgi:hypothetical protein
MVLACGSRGRAGHAGQRAITTIDKDLAGWVGEQDAVLSAGDDDVVAVAGPRGPGGDHSAVAAADDELHVDAAPVVLRHGSTLLVVHGDEGAVEDPDAAPSVAGVGPRLG